MGLRHVGLSQITYQTPPGCYFSGFLGAIDWLSGCYEGYDRAKAPNTSISNFETAPCPAARTRTNGRPIVEDAIGAWLGGSMMVVNESNSRSISALIWIRRRLVISE